MFRGGGGGVYPDHADSMGFPISTITENVRGNQDYCYCDGSIRKQYECLFMKGSFII